MGAQLDAIKIEQLSILLAAVKLGSFAAVAQARNISASSISRTIQGLEDHLGFQLFERSTRHLQLTEAGAIYCDSIKPGLDCLCEAQIKALDSQNIVQGTLRVSLPPGFGENKVIPLVKKFRELHPQLDIQLLITSKCLDFSRDRIDLAVRVGGVNDPNLTAIPLTNLEFYLCVSPELLQEHEINEINDLKKVSGMHFLEQEEWYFRHLYDDSIAPTALRMPRNLFASNVNAIARMCVLGMGVGLVPSWVANEQIEKGRLVRLFADYEISISEMPYKVSLLYSSNGYVPMKTRVFADFLEQELSELKFS